MVNQLLSYYYLISRGGRALRLYQSSSINSAGPARTSGSIARHLPAHRERAHNGYDSRLPPLSVTPHFFLTSAPSKAVAHQSKVARSSSDHCPSPSSLVPSVDTSSSARGGCSCSKTWFDDRFINAVERMPFFGTEAFSRIGFSWLKEDHDPPS